MSVYLTAIVVCVALVVALLWLLRTRRIREKYAAIWILLTIAVVLVGTVPRLAFWLSDLVGVQTPVNLVFALAILVLFAVGIQLSTEVSELEEETRTLAEEIALLRLEVARLGAAHPHGPHAPDAGATDAAAAPADPAGTAGPTQGAVDEAR